MRAKGSERNKQIAVLFSNVVSLSEPTKETIPCIGPKSLFAAFAQCFPYLTRDGKDPDPNNKQGISILEMNKSLINAGFNVFRKREYVSGICKRGTQHWRSRRWVDFASNQDMAHLVSKLNELHVNFPDTRSLTPQIIFSKLSDVVSSEPSYIRDSRMSVAGDMALDVEMLNNSTCIPSAHLPCVVAHSIDSRDSSLCPASRPFSDQLSAPSANYSTESPRGLLESLNASVLSCFLFARQLRLRFLGECLAPPAMSRAALILHTAPRGVRDEGCAPRAPEEACRSSRNEEKMRG